MKCTITSICSEYKNTSERKTAEDTRNANVLWQWHTHGCFLFWSLCWSLVSSAAFEAEARQIGWIRHR
jgi:hypothetical protein